VHCTSGNNLSSVALTRDLNVTKIIRRCGIHNIATSFLSTGFTVICSEEARSQTPVCPDEHVSAHAKGSRDQTPPLSSFPGPLSHSPRLTKHTIQSISIRISPYPQGTLKISHIHQVKKHIRVLTTIEYFTFYVIQVLS
jgi:hypothetical protein